MASAFAAVFALLSTLALLLQPLEGYAIDESCLGEYGTDVFNGLRDAMTEGWDMLNEGKKSSTKDPRDPFGDPNDNTRSVLFEAVRTTPNETPQSREKQRAWQLSQLEGKTQLSTLSSLDYN
jgi:hypothetical protein